VTSGGVPAVTHFGWAFGPVKEMVAGTRLWSGPGSGN
jgi:hypothetical protein